jgi:arabinogalactan oligomer/maltooligosaccharide transport system permease protein
MNKKELVILASRSVVFNKKSTWTRMKENAGAYAYILPAILVVLIVSMGPLLYAIWLAFTNTDINTIGTPNIKFVGFRNFYRAFMESTSEGVIPFTPVLWRTLYWTVINVFFHVSIGIALALLLNRKSINNIFRKVSRSLLILPWAVPNLVTLLVWRSMMYNEQYGFVNYVLGKIGITAKAWTTGGGTDGFWPFLGCVIANIWLGFPFMMMVATGGLQSIPEDIYEAGSIDGASPTQKLFNLTLPLLKPTMVPSVILGTIWTFTNFNAIYLITQGNPANKTQVISTFQFTALYQGNYCNASTYAIITSLILICITMINLKVNKALDEEVLR